MTAFLSPNIDEPNDHETIGVTHKKGQMQGLVAQRPQLHGDDSGIVGAVETRDQDDADEDDTDAKGEEVTGVGNWDDLDAHLFVSGRRTWVLKTHNCREEGRRGDRHETKGLGGSAHFMSSLPLVDGLKELKD
ncbi:hypothetical protein EV401DRAFT_1886055 [Pisolithus croceorrhizus]|nr:hypothetical protein EV401DRAFT_1886055 [Pisolithus croceorrhizus]